MKIFSATIPTVLMIASVSALYTAPAHARGENGALGENANTYPYTGSLSRTTGNRMNWESENNYWRNQYSSRPYYNRSTSYTVYEPAYRYGTDLYNQNPGMRWEDLNSSQLSNGWNQARNRSNLDWSDAELAAKDAYNRMYENRQQGMAGSDKIRR